MRSLTRYLRHDGPDGSWAVAERAPHPSLRPHVRAYQGFAERVPGIHRRQEVPSGIVALLIGLGPAIGMASPGRAVETRGVFIAGLHETFVVTETYGAWRGLQVNFTPPGARRFFGMPMDLLANRVVELEDVFGADARRLVSRLAEASGWDARFDIIEAEIARRFAAAPAPPSDIAWAWRRLDRSGGRLAIAGIADELGCSGRHLIARFRREIGLPPKRFARILRFGRAVARLQREVRPDWAELAFDCGYYDQSHLINDFRVFAGGTPEDFRARILALGIDGTGLLPG